MIRRSDVVTSVICLILFAFGLPVEQVQAQALTKQMVTKYRQSVVYLRVMKTTNTGEVFETTGTGFVVSDRGHVLTNCHVVEKLLRGADGAVIDRPVDSVVVQGAIGSKEGVLENMSFLGCEQPGIDLALLKFKNTSTKRNPVVVVPDQPEFGEDLASMGFPLSTEFYARAGTFSGEGDEDRMLVSMVMNPGDSGGPVFNTKLGVVAISEAGYGAQTGIGVVRPIRHGARLLSLAGVNLFAVNASLESVVALDKPANSNIYYDTNTSIRQVFGKPLHTASSAALGEVKITYPVFQILDSQPGSDAPKIDLSAIAARPGYKVIGAKFVISEEAGAEIVHVGPSSDGSSVRTLIEKSNKTPAPGFGSPAFVKGYVETQQIRIK
jgi:Trypsin-like peptidase domain